MLKEALVDCPREPYCFSLTKTKVIIDMVAVTVLRKSFQFRTRLCVSSASSSANTLEAVCNCAENWQSKNADMVNPLNMIS